MKKNRPYLLFVTVILALLTACGTPATSTPTVEVPTDFPSETPTEVPTMQMDTDTPTPTPTMETATPTATALAGVVPVQLICWFCVEQVPHVMVALPQSATFQVPASVSGVTCNSVETVGSTQLVLCQGPKQSGSVTFDLSVCSNGNCSERHITAIDCSATAMPTETLTTTPTATTTSTPGTASQTPAVGATTTSTPTPVMGRATSTATPVRNTPTPTETQTPVN